MMMSQAALPPPPPRVAEADRRHPLYAEFQNYRAGCSRLLIQCQDFDDWVACKAREEKNARLAERPEYPAFMAWMKTNQGGARRCPAGCFPANFLFWIDGGRW